MNAEKQSFFIVIICIRSAIGTVSKIKSQVASQVTLMNSNYYKIKGCSKQMTSLQMTTKSFQMSQLLFPYLLYLSGHGLHPKYVEVLCNKSFI